MAAPGRGIWVALGAAAASGLIFGMVLSVLSPDNDAAPQAARPATSTVGGTAPDSPSATITTPVESDCEDRPADDFGFLNGVAEEDGKAVLAFDRAQLFFGAEATEEAERRGNELDGDYYIANDNRRERDRPVSDDVTATGSVQLTSSTGPTDVSPDTVYGFVQAHPGQLAVYLRYDPVSCDVIKIEEVWFP